MQDEVNGNMFVNEPEKHDGLVANFVFQKANVELQGDRVGPAWFRTLFHNPSYLVCMLIQRPTDTVQWYTISYI
jgi:hypothetical protein